MVVFSRPILSAPAGMDLGGGGGAAAPIDLRKSTKKISNSFVADNSSEHTYIPKLILFIVYLFDNNLRQYIDPNIIAGMVNADSIDRGDHQALMDRRKQKNPNAKPTIMKRGGVLRSLILHPMLRKIKIIVVLSKSMVMMPLPPRSSRIICEQI